MTSHAGESAVPHGRAATASHRRAPADETDRPLEPGQHDLLDPAADTAMFRAFVDDPDAEGAPSRRGNTTKALIGFVLLVLVLVVLYFTFLH